MFRYLTRIAPRIKNSSGAGSGIFRMIPHRETTGNAQDSIQIKEMRGEGRVSGTVGRNRAAPSARSLSPGTLRARPLGASRNDKRERRVARPRDACILRLTRQLRKERLFHYGVPAQEEELAMKLRGLFIAAAVLLMPTAALAATGIVTTTVSL